ncbi:MAG: glycerol-3-phosphate acyltransferase [Acidobacteria bacterium]|nr:glycerol-3-phosphate acyltransferase [Acidobacteriota bacterium]
MFQTVDVPLWALVLLAVLAAWAALDRLLVPSVRWFLRRKVNRVLEDVGQHLRIKIEPFRLTKRAVLIDRLVFDPEVMEAATAFASMEGMPREVAMARVERAAREIVPAFNAYFYFRIGYWVARRVAQLLYRVRLGITDEEGLATVDQHSTVVFIMNHRSNMDYILVAYLAAAQTALSYAVGEWARIWPLQTLIRSMGAYFVRRRSRDPLYRRVLARYIHMATSGGVTQAMYPEGGLTRDGRLAEPKKGLLDYMLRSFDPDGERDLVFVPVGINYDRVLEDRTLLLGAKDPEKNPGRLRAAATTTGFLARNVWQMALGRWHRFGYVCVNFGTPVSMRTYCREHGLRPAELGGDERFAAVGRIADRLMESLADVIPVVPVPIVATVFQRSAGPLSELELKAEAQRLMADLEARGARTYIPRSDREYAIEVGLRMLTLRHIVVQHDGLYTAVPEEDRLLAYYANSIAHLLPKAQAATDAA